MVTPRPPLKAYPGCTDRLLGDSIGVGGNASNSPYNDAQGLFCAEFGLVRQNNCVSGTGAHRAVTEAFAHYQPFGKRQNVINRNMAGHNDGIYYNAGLSHLKVAGEDRAWLTHCWAKTDIAASDAALTKTGTWSTGSTAYGDKASVLGGTPMQTSTTGDTISWMATRANYFIRCFSGKGSGGTRVGSFDVKVNGTVVASYDGDGKSDVTTLDGSSTGVNLTRYALLVPYLQAGDAVQILYTGTGYPLLIDSVGTLREPWDCEPCIRSLPPRPNPACINGSGFYVIAGSVRTGTIAGFDAIDGAICDVAEEYADIDYPVRVSFTNQFLAGSTMPGPDYEHPNSLGHCQMYNADRAALDRAFQIPVTWTPAVHNLGVSSGGGYILPQSTGLRDGKIFHFNIRLDPTAGSTLFCTQGSTYLELPPDLFLSGADALLMISCGAVVTPYGVGLVNNGYPGQLFLPNATITEATIIRGTVTLR